MIKAPKLSAKRIAIDKANASLVIIVGVATFVTVFSIVASNALIKQMTYQSRVIAKKETTLRQAKKNIGEVEKLDTAYREFAGSGANIIGGNPKGTGDKDGENARIILDALPSKYDSPALLTSLDKLVKTAGFPAPETKTVDDEVNQSANIGSANPVAVDMPFTLDDTIGSADGKRFMELFEKSIRPIQIQKLTVTGQSNALKISVTGKTYFQPAKELKVTEEVVK